MFNNRQNRRRFRLGNLARLVQLRQSVSHQPPPPPSTLPSSFAESDDNRDSPQHVSTRSKSSSPKSMEETQPQLTPPPMSKPVETQRDQLVRSPPPETGESHQQSPTSVPLSPLIPEAKPPPPLSTSESIDETRLRAPSPSQKSPPSLSDSGESQPSLPPPQANKTPPSSPLTLDATKESPRLLPSKAIDETQFQSSPRSLSEDGGSQLPKPLPETEIPTSPPTTVNATEDSQSQLPPPVPPPSPPSLSESGESQPPLPPAQADKTLSTSPSTLNAKEESQHQQSPPLLPSKSTDETLVRSSPPSLAESSESKPPLLPTETKIPPSTQNSTKESHNQPLLLSPLDAMPPSLTESGESQPPLPPSASAAKIPTSLQSTLNPGEESQSQPPPPSQTIDETRSRSSPPLNASPPSLPGESQPPLPPPAPKIPTSLQSTLNPHEESQSQPSPKTIDETRSRSSPPLNTSPPSLPEYGDSQPPLPPLPAKIPTSMQSTLNPNDESQSQPPPPSKTIDETRFRPPPQSLSESGDSQPPLPPAAAKIPTSLQSTLIPNEESQSQPPPPSNATDETRIRSSPRLDASPPSLPESGDSQQPPAAKLTLNSNEDSQSQPLLPSKSIDETLFQSSKSIEEPKTTPPFPESRSQAHSLPPQSKLLSPKASETLQSQTHMASPTTITTPPPLSSQHVIPPPKSSLPQNKPNTEPRNKGENHNPEKKSDEKLVKIPADKTEIKRETKAIWSEKRNSMPMMMMMMFINSNVQGINTSLSLDSSSIDHHPGVHLTIDYDQICDH